MIRRVAVLLPFLLALAVLLSRAGSITVAAGGDLQAALNNARPGDTILLAAGATYRGNFVLPAKGGSSYITIRSNAPDSDLPPAGTRLTPAYASRLPKLQSATGSMPALATAAKASYYVVQFVEFLQNPAGTGSIVELGKGDSTQSSLDVVPHDLVIDRCYLHSQSGVAQLRGIALNSGAATIKDSYISEIKYAGKDSQAIAGWNGPGPYTIVNNYLEASGENFMMGGSSMFIPNVTPTGITFRNNDCTKPLSWRGSSWTVKNLFELKHAQDVTIDGNVFEYNWQAAQPGYAIVLTPRNPNGTSPWTVVQRVTFTNNIVRHVSSGINILGWDDVNTTRQTNHITIRNNVFEDVSAANWGGVGRGILVTATPYVTVDGNTSFNTGSALYAYGGTSAGLVFTDNIVNASYYGVMGDGASEGSGTITKYFPGATFQGNLFVGTTKASLYPAGNAFPASMSAVGFVSLSGGDYGLAVSSPYVGKGTGGSDPGTDMDALDAAQSSGGTSGGGSGTSAAVPSPWANGDVGSVGRAGSASYADGTFTVQGAGADIWGTADSFNYTYRPLNGDGQIVARVVSLTNTSTYAKAGVMIRESLNAGSRSVLLDVKPGGGVEFLTRSVSNGSTTSAGVAGAAPVWLRLTRSGSSLTASLSTDGLSWTRAGSASMALNANVYVGLAVCSHNTSQLNTATFDSVTVTSGSAASSGTLTDQDIGAVGLAGSASESGGTYTVKGAGADIWGTADGFNFAWQALAGDGQIVTRVASLQNTSTYAKAGVMIRNGVGSNAAHVILDVKPGGGLELLARSAAGGTTSWLANGSGAAPIWLKLARSGSTFTGYSSSDGTTWTKVGSTTVTMAGSADAGLAVCSHNTAQLNTATFDHLSVGATAAAAVGSALDAASLSSQAEEIVVHASDVPGEALHGSWVKAADATAADGTKLSTADAGWSSTSAPIAQPADYFDVTFDALAGQPYTLWLRLRAASDSKYNESVWVQFSDARVNGAPVYALDSTGALLVNLENCSGCGVAGWGWHNTAYWLSQAATVTFATSGPHTLRVQVREDGVEIDQVVLSPSAYLDTAPGGLKNDTTIVPR
jgi:regulation of enolase protein 1 (concanavalin A-like superfamily)